MAHKNREKRAAKKAREMRNGQDIYEDYYDDEDDDYDDYEEEEERPKRRRRRGPHPAIVGAIVTVVIIFVGFWGVEKVYNTMLEPVDPSSDIEWVVTIPEGASTSAIATLLRQNGLIRDGLIMGRLSEYVFRDHSKRMEYDDQFQYGEFILRKDMSVDEIIQELISGSVAANTMSFTIPEGYTTAQIASLLGQHGIVSEMDFLDEIQNGAFDFDFLVDCPPGFERLEGFLYPETYEVYADATARDVILKMLEQFDELFKLEYYERAEQMGVSIREIVTMASIIERESVVAAERPIMAGVFWNRIAQGIRLESCATIQFILGEPKEFLTNDDLQIESPFNTYLHEGLPPGPICNPRMASVEAALFPTEHDYVFFVLSDALDGSHNFSSDYNEFLANKDAYYAAIEGR